MSRSLLPACVLPSNPYSFGPIRVSEMREDEPCEGENFGVTSWGRLGKKTTAPPHASLGRRSSGTIDRLKILFDEEPLLLSGDIPHLGVLHTFNTVTSFCQYVLITGEGRTLRGNPNPHRSELTVRVRRPKASRGRAIHPELNCLVK